MWFSHRKCTKSLFKKLWRFALLSDSLLDSSDSQNLEKKNRVGRVNLLPVRFLFFRYNLSHDAPLSAEFVQEETKCVLPFQD
jgi:hypothetical protein